MPYLDRVIGGTRYRSHKRIPFDDRQYYRGVRRVALWICRDAAVLETDSQWVDTQGRRTGTVYGVIDPRDVDLDDQYTGGEARDMLQRIADEFRGYAEEDTILALLHRHAPTAPTSAEETSR